MYLNRLRLDETAKAGLVNGEPGIIGKEWMIGSTH